MITYEKMYQMLRKQHMPWHEY